MSASLIATSITINEIVGSLLVGASLVLTTHSLSRMIFLQRSGSKLHLFPIINVAQFINELAVFFLITTAFNTISFRTALWLNVVNNIAYFITKPTTMYLAYLRCSAVYPKFRKMVWLHAFFIGFRAAELFAIVVVNIVQNYRCDGSVAAGTRCAELAIAWTFRDAGAPIFRFYYIICEAIFYGKLFKTLKGMTGGKKNLQLIQYRRLQTSLFTVDLILLVFMSIYRIIGIFDQDLPTYVYYELFSSTLTIFNLTEFGLNIRILFNTITEGKSTDPADGSSGKGGPAMTGVSSSSSNASRLEMESMAPSTAVGDQSSHRQPSTTVGSIVDSIRPATRHNSSSPLTSFAADAGYNSDYDLSSPRHSQQQHHYKNQQRPLSPLSSIVSVPTAAAIEKARDTHDDYLAYTAGMDAPTQSYSYHPWESAGRGSRSLTPTQEHIVAPAKLQSQTRRQQQQQQGFYEFTTSPIASLSSRPSLDARTPPSPRQTSR
ncbi:hypothetical protein EMPS_00804 [Entomortierella parvispora]|uniref:Uncharacterized protein n=1 Tax=Entomortierella parvispora TaxID=205924 RepID=A0A9P3H2D4_9FUNG|nr:hypothetical protein EMPS_00804 [Entomortierella parvispora]